MKVLRHIAGVVVAIFVAASFSLLAPTLARAQAATMPFPAGNPAVSQAPTPTPSSTSGATVKPGEITSGNTLAAQKLATMFSAVITAAVQTSQLIRNDADKFAGGLAVITIVLAAIRFSATHSPVMAWVTLLEELAILGIFASIYVGYLSFAPGFFGWFGTLANKISPGMDSGVTMFMSASGQLYDAFIKSFEGAHWWEYPKLIAGVLPLVIAWGVLSLTTIVFTFFVNVGQLQAAAGIVVGQIAVALGFSSYTRGYFKSWLDYMISSGMYIVVAAILIRLVSSSLTTAIAAANAIGLSTPEGAVYVMDLAIFVFLLSFEIPKMAGMFGGGANASGAVVGKIAKTATGGLL